jgi:hypothetical protein
LQRDTSCSITSGAFATQTPSGDAPGLGFRSQAILRASAQGNPRAAIRFSINDCTEKNERGETLPLAQEPIASPAIKTEITTDNNGVMTPKAVKARRIQTIW